MHYRLLTLNESEEWTSLFNNVSGRRCDVQTMPAFYKLFESRNEGKAHCFVFEHGNDCALYPFLMREVNSIGFELDDIYYDITAPYGYNGVFSSTQDALFLQMLSSTFDNFCKERNVIAELVRFNPVLKNEQTLLDIESVHVLDNVGINLSQGYEHVWLNLYKPEVRNRIRKATTHDLQFEYYLAKNLSDEKLRWFIDIYNSTMARKQAMDYYRFEDNFFFQVVNGLPLNSVFFFVLAEGRPVATQLVLFADGVAYLYLAGSFAEASVMYPNEYLIHKMIPVLIDMGVKYYSMGGGVSRDDSLYQYKKKFARNIEPQNIYIGKKIRNESVYGKVINQWQQRFPELVDRYRNYILKYRYTS